MVVEEYELTKDIKQFMYQQEKNRANMYKHLRLHKQCIPFFRGLVMI
jgi:hypothetical protein